VEVIIAETGADYFTSRHDREHQARRLVSQLEKLASPSSSPPPGNRLAARICHDYAR
jgi:hypothetical protein